MHHEGCCLAQAHDQPHVATTYQDRNEQCSRILTDASHTALAKADSSSSASSSSTTLNGTSMRAGLMVFISSGVSVTT